MNYNQSKDFVNFDVITLSKIENETLYMKNYQILIIPLLNNDPNVSNWIHFIQFLFDESGVSPKTRQLYEYLHKK